MKTKTLAKQPDGLTYDLEDGATTMWVEPKHACPNNPNHDITGSTRMMYCYQCGIWWYRGGWGEPRYPEDA